MPKYLFTANYSAEGVKGLIKDGGTRRREVVERLAKGMGGSVEAFYYSFGDDDLVVIVDLPDDASATAVSLPVSASGVAGVKTTVLITPETVDEAAKKTVDYTPPGQ